MDIISPIQKNRLGMFLRGTILHYTTYAVCHYVVYKLCGTMCTTRFNNRILPKGELTDLV
jgi:hypothetical protein